MSITTVVFDFGNVVGTFSHRQSAEQVAVYTHLLPDAVLAHLYGGKLEDDFEVGRIGTPAFIAQARDKCRLTCTDEQFAAAYADMFAPNPDVCDLLPRLKGRYRLYLLSNTNDLHYRHFRRQFADVLAHFDGLVLSHEVGARKPNVRIYEHCLQLAGRPAAECLFVDDLPANIAGARAAGWHGLLYRPGDDLARGLAELGVTV